MRRPLLLALILLAPTTTLAEPAAPLATAQPDATDQQIAAWTTPAGDAATVAPSSKVGAEPAPRAIHGEVEATMGSGGYRGVRAAAVMPVGEDGALGVAVGDEHLGRRYGGGDHRSFAFSLQLGPGGASSPNCGFRHTGVKLAEDVRTEQLCGHKPGDPAALEPEGGPILR